MIELLAIIVILAVIAVITVPIILNIIENSKKGACADSAYGYKDSIQQHYLSKTVESTTDNVLETDVIKTVSELETDGLTVSGDKPTEGWVQLNKGQVVDYSLKFGDYVVSLNTTTNVPESIKNGEIKTQPSSTPTIPVYTTQSDTYTEVDYIKSTGTQYINLGYKAKTTTEVRLDMQLIENTNTHQADTYGYAILGNDNASATTLFCVNIGGSANQYKTLFYWVGAAYNPSTSTIYEKEYSSVTSRSTMTLKSGSATFQGETLSIETKNSNNADNLVLLGTYINSAMRPFARYDVKVYNCQIYEGDSLIMNLVPVVSNNTDKYGLFDTVSETFYPSGGNDFIYE